MKPVKDIISERISNAIEKATGKTASAIVTAATDAKFGDYQSNAVMALAKQQKTNPRQLAEKIVSEIEIDDICEKPEIAGPGFINLRLKPELVAGSMKQIKADSKRLAVEKVSNPETVVVDFSGPNIAKQMHVGHLRSSIIGDCICRMLEFAGHKVIRQNHIGDWGTQFGMLIAYLEYSNEKSPFQTYHKIDKYVDLSDIEEFYKKAKNLFDTDEEFAKKAKEAVVKLQSHDKQTISDWELLCKTSMAHCETLYSRMMVNLGDEHIRGESFYNDMLAGVVDELKEAGLAVVSDGAVCVFPDEEKFKNKDGDALPFIIQKSDGAFLYATTDLAAIKYRIKELGAKRIVYVTDARQKLHFEMLFAVARKAGWADNSIKLEHITFGSVMGDDGKPFKTRSGESVKLAELLDEAVERARKVVEEKNPELDNKEKAEIASAVGIGAVKYADYSNNRTSDYIFSFDKMLAMEGNTAPYMQYAYARVRSIQRKASEKGIDVDSEIAEIETANLEQAEELSLAKHLIKYSEAIATACDDYKCNIITSYLYELAGKFSSFYNACPVLIADESQRPSRLLLCDLTAETIKHGLGEILGINVIEKM